MKILHVAAHLGAGAGKAIAGIALADENNQYQVLLTDKPEKMDYVDQCRENGIPVHICPNDSLLDAAFRDADIVIVNWWHHPSLFRPLIRLGMIPSRTALWSHVNGWYYPTLSAEFVRAFDTCMFTSESSFSPPHWSPEDVAGIANKSVLVYGMGDFHPQRFPFKQSYDLETPIKIGYVGSLDKAKMHPDFFLWCAPLLQDKNCRLFMAGDPSRGLLDEIAQRGLTDKITLLGFQKDIPALLPSFDVFVYLLNPYNFATTENALLEAMAAGLPVVVGNSPSERAIISDDTTGLVVKDGDDFLTKTSSLLENIESRRTLGENARGAVIRKYSLESNLSRFSDCMSKLYKLPKQLHDFKGAVGDTSLDWFLSGCGKREKELFIETLKNSAATGADETVKGKLKGLEQIFRGKSKGSVNQFASYFSKDSNLCKLEKILR